MKIAIYHNLLSGGAKRALRELAARLSERHQLDVYSTTSAEHAFGDLRPFAARHETFEFRPQPLLRSPFGRLNQAIRWMDLLRLRRLGRSIAERIEGDGYDIAFVHPCRFENSPSLLRHLRNVPAAYYCQEPLRLLYEPAPHRPYDRRESPARQTLDRVDPLLNIYRRALRANDRHNLRAAGVVLVNSGFIRDSVRRIYDVEPQVSYLGVDASLFRPLAVEKSPVLLSVGSLTPLKGFDFLIRSLGRIPARRRPRLRIVCNFEAPMEREFLEGIAREAGVELELLSGVDDHSLVRIYNEAALTAYAPVREPFGLVALESLACGTPVVAVREGGIQETVVDGKVGILVERDEARFAQAVERLRNRPATAREFGRAGREHVLGHWTWERAVGNLQDTLVSLTRRSPGKAWPARKETSIEPARNEVN